MPLFKATYTSSLWFPTKTYPFVPVLLNHFSPTWFWSLRRLTDKVIQIQKPNKKGFLFFCFFKQVLWHEQMIIWTAVTPDMNTNLPDDKSHSLWTCTAFKLSLFIICMRHTVCTLKCLWWGSGQVLRRNIMRHKIYKTYNTTQEHKIEWLNLNTLNTQNSAHNDLSKLAQVFLQSCFSL